MDVLKTLAEFTADLRYADIPNKTLEFTKELLSKQVAAMVAGSTCPATKQFANIVRCQRLPEDVGVIGCGFKTTIWESVVLNGFSAHNSELEDVQHTRGESWDCTVIPLLVPLAQKLRLSGKALLTAITAGMEVHTRINYAFGADEYGYCMPITGGMGPAAGAAKAYGLDAKRTLSAMGFSLSSVNESTANLGTEAHFFESGLGCLQPLIGTELAREGQTSNPDLKFYQPFVLKNRSIDKINDGLGKKWLFMDQWIKKYPVYFGMHRHLDALDELMKEHKFTYDQVELMEAHVSSMDLCADNPEPKTDGAIHFSFQHSMGALLLDGEINMANHNLDAAYEPKYKKARSKVKLVVHPEYSKVEYMVDPAEVVVKLKNGKKFSKVRNILKGHPDEPLTAKEFKNLYRRFTRGVLSEAQIDRSMELIWNLEELNNIDELMNIITFGRQ